MAEKVPKFTFSLTQGKKFSALEDKDNKELLKKWSMQDLCAQMFTFDQPFQAYQKDEFVLDFLRDPVVVGNLKMSSGNGLVALGQKAEKVKAQAVLCSILSMSYFDRLYGAVVRDSGHLVKCYDEFFEDFTVADELRKMFVCEESDHYDLYSDTEKEEFLFRLFQHVCMGGQLCQYEDEVDAYLNFTKHLYKDLISVQKNSETKELSIISSVFKIKAILVKLSEVVRSDKDDDTYYPASKYHSQTFSYLIVDPLKRHATVLYHKFGGGIFRS